MKKISLVFFVIASLLVLNSCYHTLMGIDPREMILGDVIKETNQKLNAKYHINLASVGRSHKDLKVKSLTIDFNRFSGPVSKEDGRRMIIDCVEEYLKRINQKESLRPFLFQYPFSHENLTIMITHWNKDKTMLFDPDIDTFILFSDTLLYYTTDPETKNFKTKTKETYKEAKSLIKKITPRD